MIENEPDPLRRIHVKRPAEIHAEIGSILSASRLKRGLTLEAAAQQTRIPKRYLAALEENRFDEFPAFVYMRGFLKSYCDHIDAPFEQLWERLQPLAPVESEAAPAAGHGGDEPATTPKAAVDHAAHSHSSNSSGTGAIIFSALCVLALGLWIISDRKSSATSRYAESTPRALMPLARATQPKVELKALDEVWLRATVDGVVTYEGRLPQGAVLDWKPLRSVSLRANFPAALVLKLNGAAVALEHPSASGEYRIDIP